MTKRTYDIRVRNAVARSGDPDLFRSLNIPRSAKALALCIYGNSLIPFLACFARLVDISRFRAVRSVKAF